MPSNMRRASDSRNVDDPLTVIAPYIAALKTSGDRRNEPALQQLTAYTAAITVCRSPRELFDLQRACKVLRPLLAVAYAYMLEETPRKGRTLATLFGPAGVRSFERRLALAASVLADAAKRRAVALKCHQSARPGQKQTAKDVAAIYAEMARAVVASFAAEAAAFSTVAASALAWDVATAVSETPEKARIFRMVYVRPAKATRRKKARTTMR